MPSRWKGIQFDYDFISSQPDDDAIPVCLTWRERQILLTLTDPIGWKTRWEGSPVQDVIDGWRDNIVHKLMGECDMDCDDVLACLTGGDYDSTFIAWLILLINNNGDLQNGINGTDTSAGMSELTDINTLTGFGTCDNDKLFGYCLQLVQLMHSLVLDAFQIFEVATNYLELLSACADEIPILTELTDFLTWAQDNYFENYEANYDVALENQYACDLFCFAKDRDCVLTWADLFNYFIDQAGAGWSGSDIADYAQWLITGTWDGDEFCSTAFALLALVLGVGGDWTGITLPAIQVIITSFFNDPNSDWVELCDECPGYWCHEFGGEHDDFPTDFLTFIYGSFNAVTNTLEGEFRAIEGDTDFIDLDFDLLFPETVDVYDLSVTFDIDASNSSYPDPDSWYAVQRTLPTISIIMSHTGASNHVGVYEVVEEDIDMPGTKYNFRTTARFDDGEQGDTKANITYIKICGGGTDPFEEA